MRTRFVVTSSVALAACLALARPAAAQDEAQIKKGQEVYAAQKCQMCHSIAGKGSKTNPLDGVGKKLSAEDTEGWIVTSRRDDGEGQVDEEAADAGQVRLAAGSRPRRARRLPAKPRNSPTPCRA